jgi:signal peptidase I
MTDAGDPPPIAPPTHRSFSRVLLATLGIALLLLGIGAAIARTFYVANFQVPDADMAPTLLRGDRILVRKDAYRTRDHGLPERGDLVVFRHPEHPEQEFVERVIGIPGDTITVQDGAAFINGWRIPTCVAGVADVDLGAGPRTGFAVLELIGDATYLVFRDPPKHSHEEESETHATRGQNEGPFTVPNNEVFVLGDNREHSNDSRYWRDGKGAGVPVDHIKGRATLLWKSGKSGHLVWSKPGSNLTAAPKCPEGFPPGTCDAIERCLSIRPPREQMSPPPSSSASEPH